jgi:hypothetical protein
VLYSCEIAHGSFSFTALEFEQDSSLLYSKGASQQRAEKRLNSVGQAQLEGHETSASHMLRPPDAERLQVAHRRDDCSAIVTCADGGPRAHNNGPKKDLTVLGRPDLGDMRQVPPTYSARLMRRDFKPRIGVMIVQS